MPLLSTALLSSEAIVTWKSFNKPKPCTGNCKDRNTLTYTILEKNCIRGISSNFEEIGKQRYAFSWDPNTWPTNNRIFWRSYLFCFNISQHIRRGWWWLSSFFSPRYILHLFSFCYKWHYLEKKRLFESQNTNIFSRDSSMIFQKNACNFVHIKVTHMPVWSILNKP